MAELDRQARTMTFSASSSSDGESSWLSPSDPTHATPTTSARSFMSKRGCLSRHGLSYMVDGLPQSRTPDSQLTKPADISNCSPGAWLKLLPRFSDACQASESATGMDLNAHRAGRCKTLACSHEIWGAYGHEPDSSESESSCAARLRAFWMASRSISGSSSSSTGILHAGLLADQRLVLSLGADAKYMAGPARQSDSKLLCKSSASPSSKSGLLHYH